MGHLKGGDVIKYIPPPYDQPKPLSLIGQEPEGWRDLGRTPAETLQVIGVAKKVPKSVSVDLGFSDILITDGKTIQFAGKGLVTDVGKRLPSPTRGMSVSGTDALPLGGSFAELIRRMPKDKADKDFIEARMSEHMSKMTSERIAEQIEEAQAEGTLAPTLDDILRHLPDVVRGNVKLVLKRAQEAKLAPQFRKTTPKGLPRRPKEVAVGIISLKGMEGL